MNKKGEKITTQPAFPIIASIFSKNEARAEIKAAEDTFNKDGDFGTSKTINGEVLPKDHEIFHAIGATEELLSYLGYVLDK